MIYGCDATHYPHQRTKRYSSCVTPFFKSAASSYRGRVSEQMHVHTFTNIRGNPRMEERRVGLDERVEVCILPNENR